jgi:hypothetical protein
MCIFFVLYSPYYNANVRARKIIKGDRTINVLYEEGKKESTSVVKEIKSSLIGSTEKFMFFYNHSDKSTIVIPITKIISINTDYKP